MHSEVTVTLSPEQEFRADLRGVEPMAHEAARRWLDEQFTTLDCEPLRLTGKVLLADKLLTVARAAGAARLGDADWLQAFARAATGVMARPVIRINVPAMTVGY